MAHNRKLVFSGVALVKARLKNEIPAMSQVRDELEQVLIAAGWFPAAPFRWVGITFRYGLKTESEPHFQGINKKHGDLSIAVELDTNRILEIHTDLERLKAFIKVVALDCLLKVAQRYDLPVESLEQEKQKVVEA
ncbi:MAG: Imm39 family immunity protein [Verrucomicrobia bacterium]|nr:Imm39 family immunity protein [Verrucomicrobiota bacterium]